MSSEDNSGSSVCAVPTPEGTASVVVSEAPNTAPQQNIPESSAVAPQNAATQQNVAVSSAAAPQIPSRESPSHSLTSPSSSAPPPRPPKAASSQPSPASPLSPAPQPMNGSSPASAAAVAAAAPPAATAAADTAAGVEEHTIDEVPPVYDGPGFLLEVDGHTDGRPFVFGGSDITGFAVIHRDRIRRYIIEKMEYVEVSLCCKMSQSRFSKSKIVLCIQRIPISPFLRQCMFYEQETKFDFAIATRPESAASFIGSKTSFAREYFLIGRLVSGEKDYLAEVERELWFVPIVDALNVKMHPPGFMDQPAVAVTKHFTWSLTKRGSIHLTASLQQKAFCSGEDLAVSISVDNYSNVPVEGVFLQIVQFLWRKDTKRPVNEDVVVTSSNVLEHSPVAPRCIVPRGGSSFTFRVTMPRMDGISPAWSFGEYSVSHAVKIVLTSSKDVKSGELLNAYMNFLVASCRGIPSCVKHTYTYDKAVAYTKSSENEVDSPYVMALAQHYEQMAAAANAARMPDEHPAEPALDPACASAEDDPEIPPEGLNEKNVCVVCQERLQTHCIVPCGHKCLCSACAKLFLKTSVCPICRGKVNSIIRVFDV